MGNTVSSKIRVVKYRAIIANDIVDRFGFFLVDMDANGQPIRADVLGYVGYKIVNQFAEDGKRFVSQLFSILQEGFNSTRCDCRPQPNPKCGSPSGFNSTRCDCRFRKRK